MVRRAFVVALLISGCSRSRLLDGDASALTGSGSNAPSTIAATTGSAGEGGASQVSAGTGASTVGAGSPSTSNTGGATPGLSCDELIVDGPPVPIATLAPGTADNLRFHFLDDQRVALVHRPFDIVAGLRLGSTTLAWTGAWPPTAEPPVELLDQVGLSFAVDRGPDPLLGVLTSPAGDSGIWLDSVDPALGGWKKQVAIDGGSDRAVFLRRKGLDFMTATVAPGTSSFGPFYQLRVGWFDGTALRGPYNAGCSSVPVIADALAMPNGWLLARSSPAASTCSAFAPAPPPKAMTVDLIVNDMPVSGAEIPFGGDSGQLALVRRPGGAWLLFWSGPTTLVAILLNDFSQIAGGPVPLASVTEQPFAFAADQLDDGIALLLYDAPSTGPTGLHVLVKDAFANTKAVATIASPQKLTTAPQLAFDPKTRSILVGYSAIDDGKQRTYLARLACR